MADVFAKGDARRLVAALRDVTPDTIGKFLEEFRFLYGMTRRVLAREAHVPEQTIVLWENKDSKPSLKRFGDVVCVIVDKLLAMSCSGTPTDFDVELRNYQTALMACSLVHCHFDSFGFNLRRYRLANGMTQTELSEKIAPCSQRTISAMENNEYVGAPWLGWHAARVERIRAWAIATDLGGDLNKHLGEAEELTRERPSEQKDRPMPKKVFDNFLEANKVVDASHIATLQKEVCLSDLGPSVGELSKAATDNMQKRFPPVDLMKVHSGDEELMSEVVEGLKLMQASTDEPAEGTDKPEQPDAPRLFGRFDQAQEAKDDDRLEVVFPHVKVVGSVKSVAEFFRCFGLIGGLPDKV